MEIPQVGFLRLPQILGDRRSGTPPLIPVGKTCWWDGIKHGRFPEPVKLGQRAVGWRASDIRALIDRLGAARAMGAGDEARESVTKPPAAIKAKKSPTTASGKRAE